MAQHFAANGEIGKAISGCRQVLEIDAKHGGARDLQKQIDDALDSNTGAHLAQTRELAQHSEMDKAADILNTVLKREPKNFDARLILGLIFLQKNKFAETGRQLRQVIALKPDYAQAYNDRG